jgi:hypothetical protein
LVVAPPSAHLSVSAISAVKMPPVTSFDARMTPQVLVDAMPLSTDQINTRTGQIVDAAIKVHTIIGPGMLESVYQTCLAYELEKEGSILELRSQFR